LSPKPGQNRPSKSKWSIDGLRRRAVARPVLTVAVVLVAVFVAVAVAALASGRGGDKPGGSTHPTASSSSTRPARSDSSGPTGSTQPGRASATGTTKPAVPTPSTRPPVPGAPAAPWLASPVPGAAVPAPFLEAWQRAKNRSKCALLVPSETGPRMEGATATFDPTPDDRGWDILLRKEAGIIEILGLFSRADKPEDRAPASFTRQWSDGSEVRYGAEAGGGPEVSPDPEANAFEGVLTIPTQDCAYRIYDTLGFTHFEFVLDHLRFAEGAR
jgi:hypothetical protein